MNSEEALDSDGRHGYGVCVCIRQSDLEINREGCMLGLVYIHLFPHSPLGELEAMAPQQQQRAHSEPRAWFFNSILQYKGAGFLAKQIDSRDGAGEYLTKLEHLMKRSTQKRMEICPKA